MVSRTRKRGRAQGRGAKGTWAIVVGVACLLFSVLALLAGFDDAGSVTSETKGRVITADESAVGRGHQCDVDYQYDVNGRTYRIQTYWDGGCGDIRSDSTNTVYYDPRDPERSTLQNPTDWTELYVGPLVLFGFGAVFITLGAAPVIEKIRASRPKR